LPGKKGKGGGGRKDEKTARGIAKQNPLKGKKTPTGTGEDSGHREIRKRGPLCTGLPQLNRG